MRNISEHCLRSRFELSWSIVSEKERHILNQIASMPTTKLPKYRRKSEWLLVRKTREEKNLENVLTNGRQTLRKLNDRFRHLDLRTHSWNSFDPVWLPPSRLSFCLLLSPFCCLSFFFYLTKTLSVESARSFFSTFVVHWSVHCLSSCPHSNAS